MTTPRSCVVLAPMAGGPTTLPLVAEVARAGGFGFLAAGYLSIEDLSSRIDSLRAVSPEPFGVNVYVPSSDSPVLMQAARDHAARLAPMAELAGIALGSPRWDDDAYAAKLDLLIEARPSVVSFAFGWPSLDDVGRLQRAGVEVWVTVNDPGEVEWATEIGADGIVAQGWEAGGHRGGPVDNRRGLPTRDLVNAVKVLRAKGTHLVAAGGAMSAQDVQSLLSTGADAVACGTAFLRADEAGTADVHRHALTVRADTVVTRTFTGRSGRALRTSWTDLHSDGAPAAYPQVHHVTAPLRAFGKASGQADLVHLWAGTGHGRVRSGPAYDIADDLLAGTG
ncbi:MAG: nitronate monooxygenase [Nostocoides sp.]